MKVKITPTGESAQVMEFNVSLPCGANASIAPVSKLHGFTEPLHATITSDATSSTSTAEDPTYSR